MIGLAWKILPIASGFFFAVSHPDISKEINDTVTPIAYFIKDAVLGTLAYIGALI